MPAVWAPDLLEARVCCEHAYRLTLLQPVRSLHQHGSQLTKRTRFRNCLDESLKAFLCR